ncbi:MAG TPA: lysylphosphatidylglycerol synthase domain-containing protein [Stellaceae bacterium]
MTLGSGRHPLVRAGMAICGLAAALGLAWYALSGTDIALLFNSWVVPAIALLHLVQQAGCGGAWQALVQPPRPVLGYFFCARWVRASVAALVPVSGVGAAIVAIRIITRAGLEMDLAAASLVADATLEMIAQIIFTMLGLGLLIATSPWSPALGSLAAGLLLAILATAVVIALQRAGALRVIDAALARLARRWPRLLFLGAGSLHDRLMHLHRQRRAVFVAGIMHLAAWLLGAGEIWLVLYVLGRPAGVRACVIIESLAMAARSAGFLVPGALGIQEAALLMVGGLVGLSAESAMAVAVVKRLRDIAIGVPGLLVWQWIEGSRFRRRRPVQ